MNREDIISRDGSTFPGASFTTAVLRPAYDQAKAQLLPSMMQINRAHLIMLRTQEIISAEDAATIATSIDELDVESLAASEYTGEYEDLFFTAESRMLAIGGDAVGNLQIARSRNDIGMNAVPDGHARPAAGGAGRRRRAVRDSRAPRRRTQPDTEP
jgi:argininosuccinate lyase